MNGSSPDPDEQTKMSFARREGELGKFSQTEERKKKKSQRAERFMGAPRGAGRAAAGFASWLNPEFGEKAPRRRWLPLPHPLPPPAPTSPFYLKDSEGDKVGGSDSQNTPLRLRGAGTTWGSLPGKESPLPQRGGRVPWAPLQSLIHLL